MNRRFFLRQVPFISGLSLALPTFLKKEAPLSELAPSARTSSKGLNAILVFSYFKTNAANDKKTVEPDFQWLKVDKYLELESAMKRDGLLLDVKKILQPQGPEYRLTFNEFNSVLKYLEATHQLVNNGHRISSGYELKISIV